MKKLYLAGGCFWCVGDYFLMQDGVEDPKNNEDTTNHLPKTFTPPDSGV